ncbi:MAG: MoaD/ThiS family protein [Halofilum sp. (in: g-proteobacteria)]|nr:MoaD/ThiS family protein [Halofilum sp. (in: g-proteobacteria)]
MPSVTLRIPTPLQPHSDGNASVTLEAASVGGAFEAVGEQYPALVQQILTRDGAVRRYVNVFVRRSDIRELDGLATALDDGDEIIVMPSVAGG